MALPQSVKYLVIGAGIHGLSTAMHLAARLEAQGKGGGKDVLVLDKTAIAKAAYDTGIVVTAEEHQVGGFGNQVAAAIGQSEKLLDRPVVIGMVGVQDRFGESGAPWELVKEFEVSAEHIAAEAKRLYDHRQKKTGAKPAKGVAKRKARKKPAKRKATRKPARRKAARKPAKRKAAKRPARKKPARKKPARRARRPPARKPKKKPAAKRKRAAARKPARKAPRKRKPATRKKAARRKTARKGTR